MSIKYINHWTNWTFQSEFLCGGINKKERNLNRVGCLDAVSFSYNYHYHHHHQLSNDWLNKGVFLSVSTRHLYIDIDLQKRKVQLVRIFLFVEFEFLLIVVGEDCFEFLKKQQPTFFKVISNKKKHIFIFYHFLSFNSRFLFCPFSRSIHDDRNSYTYFLLWNNWFFCFVFSFFERKKIFFLSNFLVW